MSVVSRLVPEELSSAQQIECWVNWALSHADNIDPIKNGALSAAINDLAAAAGIVRL